MGKRVFLSYSSADAPIANTVAHTLAIAGLEILFDRQELRLGDSFLTFMEEALSTSDYCLLLWSRNAAATKWVRLEWEAALYRSVNGKRSFLLAGRLEDVPLPALIAPRVRVDLFPDLNPGLDQIVDTWSADRDAEKITSRPVANALLPNTLASLHDTIYVTSETFAVTVPLKVNLGEPAGLCLDRITASFNLPTLFDHEGLIGVRFSYRLINGNQPLNRGISLLDQNVKDKTILWLETTMTPYAMYEPICGTMQSAGFRASGSSFLKQKLFAEEKAREAYNSAVTNSGLGPLKDEEQALV